MSDPFLKIDGLGRDFGSRSVIETLDLSIGSGTRVGLKGANGSGKTTLLRCIAGTLVPTRGKVRVGDHVAGSMAARRLVGCSLSQERSFYLRLTGRQNLLFFAQTRYKTKGASREAVLQVEEELEIQSISERVVGSCSTGMVQQLSFARALLGKPKVLLLDEPTRSLDGDAVVRFWSALDRRSDVIALVASHREDDLTRCTQILDLPQ